MFPDWLACISEWIRTHTAVTALLTDRFYTELPAAKTFPLGRIIHLTDPPVVPHVHHLVDGLFQVDVWGGSKAMTWTIAETVRHRLHTELVGAHDLTAGSFVATGVTPGGIRRDNETIEGSARPKASFDVTITLHP